MNIEIPQIIMIALLCIGMGNSMAKYGQKKTDSYDIVDVIISPAIIFSLLYWGGFFS